MSWSMNDTIIPKEDSVLVSINAIRIANAKMIELKYEKELNEAYRQTILLDSTIIDALEENLEACVVSREKEIRKYKKERNIAIGAGSGTSTILLILLILLAL